MNDEILERLEQIQIDISFIKNNVVDLDTVMTVEEEARHEEGLRGFDKGETFSLEDIKRERENAGLGV